MIDMAKADSVNLKEGILHMSNSTSGLKVLDTRNIISLRKTFWEMLCILEYIEWNNVGKMYRYASIKE